MSLNKVLDEIKKLIWIEIYSKMEQSLFPVVEQFEVPSLSPYRYEMLWGTTVVRSPNVLHMRREGRIFYPARYFHTTWSIKLFRALEGMIEPYPLFPRRRRAMTIRKYPDLTPIRFITRASPVKPTKKWTKKWEVKVNEQFESLKNAVEQGFGQLAEEISSKEYTIYL